MRTDQLSMHRLDGLGIFALMAKALTRLPAKSAPVERADTRADDATANAPARRRGLGERLDHWFWTRQQREVEAYLAKATDLHDLEARIRALERNAPHPYF